MNVDKMVGDYRIVVKPFNGLCSLFGHSGIVAFGHNIYVEKYEGLSKLFEDKKDRMVIINKLFGDKNE